MLGCFGLWELTNPGQWMGYVPRALEPFASPVPLILLHGLVLFVLGAAALVDLLPSIASWIAVAVMTEVIAGLLLTSGGASILVRDVGVLALTLAWALDSRPAPATVDDAGGTPRVPVASR